MRASDRGMGRYYTDLSSDQDPLHKQAQQVFRRDAPVMIVAAGTTIYRW